MAYLEAVNRTGDTMMRWALVGLTTVGLVGTAVAHGQQAPSDASIAQLQKSILSQPDRAPDMDARLARHTDSLVQEVVDELESSGVSFADMSSNTAPNVELASISQTGTGVKFEGKSNEIAYGSYLERAAFVVSQNGGSDVTVTLARDQEATNLKRI